MTRPLPILAALLALIGSWLWWSEKPQVSTSRPPAPKFPHDYTDGKAHTWTLRFIYRDQICIETRTDEWVSQMCGEDAARIVQAIAGSVKLQQVSMQIAALREELKLLRLSRTVEPKK